MTLKSDAKLEKPICCFTNDTQFSEFGSKHSKALCMILLKNNEKFEEELTCRFEIDMRNLMNVDPNT